MTREQMIKALRKGYTHTEFHTFSDGGLEVVFRGNKWFLFALEGSNEEDLYKQLSKLVNP